jgi:L-seryl-tRNA(Ser) seleniumtransferase
VSKEEIVGLLVALERFVATDRAAELARQERRLTAIEEQLADLPHVRLRRLSVAETGREPLVELRVDESRLGLTAFDLSLRLQQGDPPVHLGERKASEGILTVNPVGLCEGEEKIVVARIRAACAVRAGGRAGAADPRA